MSIELADKTGNIGQASTNTGFNDAREECMKLGGTLVKQFFEDGKTTQPKKVAEQIMVVAHKTKDNQIRNSLVNIAKLLKEAKGFCVVQTA
jgi:hypothetical protein